MPEPSLGRLIAVHSTSPAFLQRAAIVAALSFLFFLAALVFYLVWQNFLYFILATGFLILQIFTMIGWWMQKRNSVRLYENGLIYKKVTVLWADVARLRFEPKAGLRLELADANQLNIPAAPTACPASRRTSTPSAKHAKTAPQKTLRTVTSVTSHLIKRYIFCGECSVHRAIRHEVPMPFMPFQIVDSIFGDRRFPKLEILTVHQN